MSTQDQNTGDDALIQASKSILTSKTFWMNLIGVPLFAFLAKHNLPLDDDTKNNVILLVIVAVNIGLRYLSTGPVHLVKPAMQATTTVVKSVLLLISLSAVATLVACANIAAQPPQAQLATVCNSLATGYLTAAGYRAQGKLPASAISTLTTLEAVALTDCNTTSPPANITQAITDITNAGQQIALINAGVKVTPTPTPAPAQ